MRVRVCLLGEGTDHMRKGLGTSHGRVAPMHICADRRLWSAVNLRKLARAALPRVRGSAKVKVTCVRDSEPVLAHVVFRIVRLSSASFARAALPRVRGSES